MNREIEFRGLVEGIQQNKWIYGYYFEEGDKESIIQDSITEEISAVRYETVGQYTGLKDKNGKKIYEGDIIPTLKEVTVGLENKEIIIEVNYVVVFDFIEYDFKLTNGKEKYGNNFEYLCCVDKPEVIGNIHDSPKLLEGDK